MKVRLNVGKDGVLRDREGTVYGRLTSLTIDLDREEGGGAMGGREVSPPNGDSVVGDGTDQPQQVVGGAGGGQTTLDGTDNRKALIDAFGRIFDKPRVTHSPSRMKAADRAFKEEPDFDTLVRALEGAKAYADRMGRSYEFGDIFGTSPRTSDLASRINFFVEQAGVTQVASSLPPEIASLPSDAREMVRMRQGHVENALRNPGDGRLEETGDAAAAWLRERFGLRGYLAASGEVEWTREVGK